MARKKLLSEGEIRQFMKLANLRPIGTARLSEMYDVPGARDEEDELRDELGATEDELGDEDALADEEGDELAMADDEMAMDDAGGGAMVSMDDFMSALERAIEEVTGEEADVSEEPGDEEEVDIVDDVEPSPEGGEEMEMSVEDDMVAEIVRRLQEGGESKGDQGGEDYAGASDSEEDEEEREEYDSSHKGHGSRAGDQGGSDYGKKKIASVRDRHRARPVHMRRESAKSQDAIVKEVAKRVAARLQGQTRKEQMVDQLAERIMKRLTK